MYDRRETIIAVMSNSIMQCLITKDRPLITYNAHKGWTITYDEKFISRRNESENVVYLDLDFFEID